MTIKELIYTRLASQQIAATDFKTPKDIVSWMGVMQAQDYAMAKWGIGCRLSKSTDKQIEAAIDKGEIIRKHILRPTWHFVSPNDVHWMLDLSAPQINTLMKSERKRLELTEAVYKKSNNVIAKTLNEGQHLTRDALVSTLLKAKIAVNDNRVSLLFIKAELDKIICSGAIQDKKLTYALLAERVPEPKMIKLQEALAM